MLVVQALKQGQNDAYIDTLVNAAATAGTITVPQILVTSDGRVDTHVLLASIITQATIAAGGAAPTVPDAPMALKSTSFSAQPKLSNIGSTPCEAAIALGQLR